MSRRHRFVASLLAAFALVFAQLAVSAHACIVANTVLVVDAATIHECCNEDDESGDNSAVDSLCVEHCNYGEASFDGGQSAPGTVALSGPALRVDSLERALSADHRPTWFIAAPAAPPPAAILFGVLRI